GAGLGVAMDQLDDRGHRDVPRDARVELAGAEAPEAFGHPLPGLARAAEPEEDRRLEGDRIGNLARRLPPPEGRKIRLLELERLVVIAAEEDAEDERLPRANRAIFSAGREIPIERRLLVGPEPLGVALD